jgi:hypothetical protein
MQRMPRRTCRSTSWITLAGFLDLAFISHCVVQRREHRIRLSTTSTALTMRRTQSACKRSDRVRCFGVASSALVASGGGPVRAAFLANGFVPLGRRFQGRNPKPRFRLWFSPIPTLQERLSRWQAVAPKLGSSHSHGQNEATLFPVWRRRLWAATRKLSRSGSSEGRDWLRFAWGRMTNPIPDWDRNDRQFVLADAVG